MTTSRKKGAAPFPSKDEILRFISNEPGLVGKREIARAFHIYGADRIKLKAVLKEMADDGLLQRGHRRTVHKSDELPEVVVVEVIGRDSQGHAVVRPDKLNPQEAPPLILLKEDNKSALGIGDRALARLEKLSHTLYQAVIIKRLDPTEPPFLARFSIIKGRDGRPEGRLTPVDKKMRMEFKVDEDQWNGAKPGELVMAEEMRGRGRPLGLRPARVKEILGALDSPRSISLIAIHAHGIPTEFNPAAIRDAKKAKPPTVDGRVDLRATPLITVDPADARDHDDAVWAEADPDPKNPGGWHVIVAIADVAHYVTSGSALDRDAWTRGNSVYFPDRVVPMLPEELSADLCSLMPHVDRAVMAVHMWFTADGQKIRHHFVRGLMRSAANLSYETFQAAFDGHGTDETDPLLETVIKPLYGAYEALEAARIKRGALELDMPERKVMLDPEGKVVDVRERERLDAHKLIENFMIAANVAAAETLEAHRELCMYRVHEEPSEDKVEALRDFLSTLNIKLARGQVLSPKLFNGVLERVVDTPNAHVVNEVVLRTQTQAYYGPDNRGHFGLALLRYAHFTSPIRRYSDVLVHRGLISALKLGDDGLTADDRTNFQETAAHISATERRAMIAERESTDRYLAAFLSERTGSIFTGRIASATKFGLFVRLSETGADGLIPISSLRGDYFHLDQSRHSLIGERTGRSYRIGDSVQVRLAEATPLTGGMRFELLEEGSASGRSRDERRARPAPRGKRPNKSSKSEERKIEGRKKDGAKRKRRK